VKQVYVGIVKAIFIGKDGKEYINVFFKLNRAASEEQVICLENHSLKLGSQLTITVQVLPEAVQ